MLNKRLYLMGQRCPECSSRVYTDTVENCSHADQDGDPVYSLSVGIWCENEKCPHYTKSIDRDDLVS